MVELKAKPYNFTPTGRAVLDRLPTTTSQKLLAPPQTAPRGTLTASSSTQLLSHCSMLPD